MALAATHGPHAFPAGVTCGMHRSLLAAHLEHGLRQSQRINEVTTKSSHMVHSLCFPMHSRTWYPLTSWRPAPCRKHISFSSASPWWPASFLSPPVTYHLPHSPPPMSSSATSSAASSTLRHASASYLCFSALCLAVSSCSRHSCSACSTRLLSSSRHLASARPPPPLISGVPPPERPAPPSPSTSDPKRLPVGLETFV